MPTDMSAKDPLIDSLVADLAPVQPRQWRREAALVVGAVIFEAMAVAGVFGMRPDMPEAMATPAFWWKGVCLALVAGLGAAAVLISLDPAVTILPRLRRLSRIFAMLLPLALAAGWLIDAGDGGVDALVARLDWRDGIGCVRHVLVTAIPMLVLLVVLIRRGAPTRPALTASVAGLAAAGLGAFGFALSCPHDDPLYVAVWYGAAVAIMVALARLGLPRLIRW